MNIGWKVKKMTLVSLVKVIQATLLRTTSKDIETFSAFWRYHGMEGARIGGTATLDNNLGPSGSGGVPLVEISH